MEEGKRAREETKKNGGTNGEDAPTSLDQTAKMVIREAIISKEGDGGGGRKVGEAKDETREPDDILAFHRSVNKTDSTIQ